MDKEGMDPLSVAQAGQILWAALGITEPRRGLRTAPSARPSIFSISMWCRAT
jgi:hypothetical protein